MAEFDEYISAMAQQSEANNVFNAKQAEINRTFQKEMSDTAHQREVKDLLAAGLNPILSVNAGASTAAGSMATADTSSASGYASLASTGLSGMYQLAMAEINKNAQLQAAQISANAVISAAEKSLEGTKYSSDMNAWAHISSNPVSAAINALGNIFSWNGTTFTDWLRNGALGKLSPNGKGWLDWGKLLMPQKAY